MEDLVHIVGNKEVTATHWDDGGTNMYGVKIYDKERMVGILLTCNSRKESINLATTIVYLTVG